MSKTILSVFLCVVALGACASDGGGGGSATPDDSCMYANDGACDEPDFCEIGTDATDCGGGGGGGGTINGVPAVEYYNQFLYVIKPNDSLPHNSTSPLLGDELNLTLWLLASGTFYVTYGEIGNYQSQTGNWSVDGTQLILGTIATGNGITFNDQPSVSLRFNSSAPGQLSDFSSTLGLSSSNTSLSNHLGRNNDGVCDAALGDICGYRDETDCC